MHSAGGVTPLAEVYRDKPNDIAPLDGAGIKATISSKAGPMRFHHALTSRLATSKTHCVSNEVLKTNF